MHPESNRNDAVDLLAADKQSNLSTASLRIMGEN